MYAEHVKQMWKIIKKKTVINSETGRIELQILDYFYESLH